MPRPTLLRSFRLIHLYFGVFISPALLFFAFTGAMQTFGLHETNRDHPNYKPAHWIQVLAQIHKKQVATVPVRRPQPSPSASPASSSSSTAALLTPSASPASAKPALSPDAGSPETSHHHGNHTTGPGANGSSQSAQQVLQPPTSTPEPHKPSPLPLRIFFLLVAVGLCTSTITGLYMAYVYQRNRRLWVTLALTAGIILPPLVLLV